MPLRELHLSTMRERKKHKDEIIIDCVTKLPGKQKIRTVNIFDKEDFKRELKNCVLVQLDINNVVGDEFDCSIKEWDMQMWEDMVRACGQKIKIKEVSLMQRWKRDQIRPTPKMGSKLGALQIELEVKMDFFEKFMNFLLKYVFLTKITFYEKNNHFSLKTN